VQEIKRKCVLLFDVKAQKIKFEEGGEYCRQRLSPCSTFKVPLALMAFDSGVLPNERHLIRWDGRPRAISSWNQDQTAESWMKNSVVWYSQKLTPLLGLKKIRKYLADFKYGNQDFSGGLSEAWLGGLGKTSSLKISPYEQLEFLKSFWGLKLPVTKKALILTKRITFLENSPKGYTLHGKTGSSRPGKEKDGDLGWFVGHIEREFEEYLVVTAVVLSPSNPKSYAGFEAKELTKGFLNQQSLW
jgi:beta-lactamase class D